MTHSRFALAKAALLDNLDAIVTELFVSPRPIRRPGAWMCASPRGSHRAADQLRIFRTGPKKGGFSDFAASVWGDVIDLVAYVEFGAIDEGTRLKAVQWAEQRFGLRGLDPEERERRAARQRQRQAEAEAEDAQRRRSDRDRARRMFFAGSETLAGSPAERYLATRGIAIGEVPNLADRTFRVLAGAEYWPARARPRFPALVSRMVDAEGHGHACHLTFLEPDGAGKLDTGARGLVDDNGEPLPAKLIWPRSMGLVIRVTDGAGGLSAEAAAGTGRPGVIALTEGIEDALSLGLAMPDWRIWAAGSLPALLHVPDHAAASGWLVFRDNDWGKDQAVALFDRAVMRLRRFGKPVEVVELPREWGKDVNDVLNRGV